MSTFLETTDLISYNQQTVDDVFLNLHKTSFLKTTENNANFLVCDNKFRICLLKMDK